MKAIFDPDIPFAAERVPMELHFTRTNGEADAAIERLMDLVGGVRNRALVREMVLAALKAGQEDAGRADLKLMNSTLKEMRFTAKVFGPYRNIRKVTVFGSARTAPSEPVYRMAREFGRRLPESGYMAITGGGPGIMQAVNEGAGPEHSFGASIRLPFERTNHVVKDNPRSVTYKYFFNRKVAFLKEADAVVLFPGGFGTLDEAMECLTLVQTGKHSPIPLVLIEPPGGRYWARAVEFFQRELCDGGYINETDLSLFDYVYSTDEAIDRIGRFYRRYHSMRYVGEQLVIRMNAAIGAGQVAELAGQFSDILSPGGGMYQSGPLAPEANRPDLAHLPRLVVDFNRRDFGRLRGLVDALNM